MRRSSGDSQLQGAKQMHEKIPVPDRLYAACLMLAKSGVRQTADLLSGGQVHVRYTSTGAFGGEASDHLDVCRQEVELPPAGAYCTLLLDDNEDSHCWTTTQASNSSVLVTNASSLRSSLDHLAYVGIVRSRHHLSSKSPVYGLTESADAIRSSAQQLVLCVVINYNMKSQFRGLGFDLLISLATGAARLASCLQAVAGQLYPRATTFSSATVIQKKPNPDHWLIDGELLDRVDCL
nr:hypothetical protein CFP56_50881 [Quercus suber]